MIKYSVRAVKALTRLFNRFNDINVYVEDTRDINVYRIYLERILDGRAKVRRVFPLGSRTAVIDACKNSAFTSDKPAIYIVDGDLDLLLGAAAPDLKGLYRLNAYCIENLLVCREAAVEVAFESCSNLSKEEIARTLQFNRWRGRAIRALFPLFVLYSIARMRQLSIETCGFHVYRLMERQDKKYTLSSAKVRSRLADVEKEIAKHIPKEEYDRLVKTLSENAANSGAPHRFISGKTYLLPLLMRHMRAIGLFSDNEATVKTRLARHARLDYDPHLADFVRSAARGA